MTAPAADEDRRRLLSDFAHQLYEVRDVPGAFKQYVHTDYVQHSPALPDGPNAAVAMLTKKFADPALRLFVRRILLDGDMAALMIHGEIDSVGGMPTKFAVVDIYRLEGDLIVEHWDVNQVFPDTVANDHPFFG